MHAPKAVSALLLLASPYVYASPTTAAPSASPTASSSSEPCGLIAQAVQAGYSYVPAEQALACLQSVPVDTEGDLLQLQGLAAMLEFQSDLAYLKNPPPGYVYPGVDLQGSVADIIAKVQAGGYSNEYDVQLDIYNLIESAYDFHLVYRPDIVEVFSWFRTANIVSVSLDGTSLPQVYVAFDQAALQGVDTSYTASPISQINSVPVQDWINEYAALNPWDHDPDANFNNVVYNYPANIWEQNTSPWQYATIYQGNDTVVTFANGTTAHIQTVAKPSSYNWSGVTNGKTFFQKFCQGAAPSSSAAGQKRSPRTTSAAGSGTPTGAAGASSTAENTYAPLPTTATANSAPTTYPPPLIVAYDGSISGYFIPGQEDLAVLVVPTFQPKDNYNFQDTLRSFLASSKAAGKSRLIIDLRGNGGGTVADGFDMFDQLFPSLTPYDSTNLAAFPLMDATGQTITQDVQGGKLQEYQVFPQIFDDVADVNPATDKHYGSWEEFYGPVQRHGGEFTNLRSNNFSDPYSGYNPVYGYINDTVPQPQTFESQNIVILSDGFCGSTCAVFSELMKTQGLVSFITVGGRSQYGPSQPVGGSKGANDQEMIKIAKQVAAASRINPKVFQQFNPEDLQAQWTQMIVRLGPNPAGNVNFQNNIRKGDTSVTPLQFVYEASNCRFFYTPQNLWNQTAAWLQTYDLQWNNGACVQGSTGQPSAVGGNVNSYILSPPPVGANNSFGAPDPFSYPGVNGSNGTVGTNSTPTSRSPPIATNGAGRLSSTAGLAVVLMAAMYML